jgi:diaminopimelate epimerase
MARLPTSLGELVAVPVVKMHGLGNDYVFIDAVSAEGAAALAAFGEGALPPLARWVSDRHRGVGGDGLVLILRPPGWQRADGEEEEEAVRRDPSSARPPPIQMRMFNADGSEAEMCGNALRCVAALAEARGYTEGERNFSVLTGNGPLAVQVTEPFGPSLTASATSLRPALVTVNMGRPFLAPSSVPALSANSDAPLLQEPVDVHCAAGNVVTVKVTAVGFGNPHGVVFVPEGPATDSLVSTVGPALSRHAMFPKQANVGFAHVVGPEEIQLRVWERGSGETQACGTGACAAAVACMLAGSVGPRVRVHLPGGSLVIEHHTTGAGHSSAANAEAVAAADVAAAIAESAIMMSGPAELSFTGSTTSSRDALLAPK